MRSRHAPHQAALDRCWEPPGGARSSGQNERGAANGRWGGPLPSKTSPVDGPFVDLLDYKAEEAFDPCAQPVGGSVGATDSDVPAPGARFASGGMSARAPPFPDLGQWDESGHVLPRRRLTLAFEPEDL